MKGSCTNMQKLTTLTIVESIFIINRRVKQVSDPSLLYNLKHDAIAKLLKENKATKLYLHRYSRKIIFVIVECEGGYLFHYPADQTDLKQLEYREVVLNHRNPPTTLSYFKAKRTLIDFTTK